MKKKTIAVFTTSRADFGTLKPFIQRLAKDKFWSYQIFAGGSHLAFETGRTLNEIFDSKLKITSQFDFLLNDDSPESLTKSLGIEEIELSNIFKCHNFDFVCILGDRYELLPIVSAAILFHKPIIHISGGEITEGVIDEQIRHMVTKASHIHFTYTEEYRKNIIKLGEEKWRVFNTGALGVDNLQIQRPISKSKLFDELNLDVNRPLVMFTLHPVTINTAISPINQISSVFEALENFDFQVLVTAPNVEVGRKEVYDYIKRKVEVNQNYRFINSLGEHRYNSIIPHCLFVIGNSSSGIVYVPYFKVPTINIGDRQKGRIQHPSIINTDFNKDNIKNTIKIAISDNFRKSVNKMKYKFGDGNASQKMVDALNKVCNRKDLMIKKLVFENE